MKITLESTSQIVQFNGIDHRVWEGQTESGIPLTAFISRVAVKDTEDTSQFEAELREQPAPRMPIETWPLRMVLMVAANLERDIARSGMPLEQKQ